MVGTDVNCDSSDEGSSRARFDRGWECENEESELAEAAEYYKSKGTDYVHASEEEEEEEEDNYHASSKKIQTETVDHTESPPKPQKKRRRLKSMKNLSPEIFVDRPEAISSPSSPCSPEQETQRRRRSSQRSLSPPAADVQSRSRSRSRSRPYPRQRTSSPEPVECSSPPDQQRQLRASGPGMYTPESVYTQRLKRSEPTEDMAALCQRAVMTPMHFNSEAAFLECELDLSDWDGCESVREVIERTQTAEVIRSAVGEAPDEYLMLSLQHAAAPRLMSMGLSVQSGLGSGPHLSEADQIQQLLLPNVSIYGTLHDGTTLSARFVEEVKSAAPRVRTNDLTDVRYGEGEVTVQVRLAIMGSMAGWGRCTNEQLEEMAMMNPSAVAIVALNELALLRVGIHPGNMGLLHSTGMLARIVPNNDENDYELKQLDQRDPLITRRTGFSDLLEALHEGTTEKTTLLDRVRVMDRELTRVLSTLFRRLSMSIRDIGGLLRPLDEEELILLKWDDANGNLAELAGGIFEHLSGEGEQILKDLRLHFVGRCRALTFLFQVAKGVQDVLHRAVEGLFEYCRLIILNHAANGHDHPGDDDLENLRIFARGSLVGLSTYKFDIDNVVLPSGRLLGARLGSSGGGPRDSAEQGKRASLLHGMRRVLKLVQKLQLSISPDGDTAMAEVRVVHDQSGSSTNANMTYVCAEEHDGQLFDSAVATQQREMRRDIGGMFMHTAGKPEKGTFRSGFLTSVCDLKRLVALAHANDGTREGAAKFEDFSSAPSILRALPEILSVAVSHELPVATKPDRNRRAFLDGMLDVTLDSRTSLPSTPVIVPHTDQLQWEAYLGKKYAIKMYPYSMAGEASSGELRALDLNTTHKHPIAVMYRQIICRQPGCALTHGINIATDGDMLFSATETETPARQMAKVLLGTAKSGKSTHIDIVVDLYPTKLTGSIGGAEGIFGMMDFTKDTCLAFAQEMGSRMGISTTQLQEAIANDLVRLAVKHGKGQEFRWESRILMGGNKLGPWSDTSGSMLRRLLMWVYSLKIQTTNSNMNALLREDIGPIILCMFTAFVDLLQTRRAYLERTNQDGCSTAESKLQPDMFSAPAPAYFNRTLVSFGGQVSTILEAIQNHSDRFLFADTGACSLADLTGLINTLVPQHGEGGGRRDALDENSVKSVIDFLRCKVEASSVIGLTLLSPIKTKDCTLDKELLKARLAALMLFNILWECDTHTADAIRHEESRQKARTSGGKGKIDIAEDEVEAEAAADMSKKQKMGKLHTDRVERQNSARDTPTVFYQHHLPNLLPKIKCSDSLCTRWDCDEAMYLCVKRVLDKSDRCIRSYFDYNRAQAAVSDAGNIFSRAKEEATLWRGKDLLTLCLPAEDDEHRLFQGWIKTSLDKSKDGVSGRDARAIEKYCVNAGTCSVMFDDIVRESDRVHACKMWSLDCAPRLGYGMLKAVTLPDSLKPKSSYGEGQVCVLLKGETLAQRMLQDPAIFLGCAIDLEVTPGNGLFGSAVDKINGSQ